MADGLIGKWLSTTNENLEAFLDALTVPEELRKIARERKTEITIEKDGGNWKLTTVAGDKSRVIVFTPGHEVETVSLLGQPIKATLTVDGGDLVEKQQSPIGEIIIRRTLVDGNLKTSMTANGVTASISFNKA